jgi:hypothetical protein
MEPEVWKKIKGWDYEVSSYGRVWSLAWDREVKQKPDKDGYFRLFVRKGVLKKYPYAHVLVCSLFNGKKPFKEAQVRHLDGTVDNNFYKNLLWGTSLENHDDRRRHGRDRNGEKNQAALFSNEEVDEIRQMYESGKYTQWDIARMKGTGQGVISGILRRETYNVSGEARKNFIMKGASHYRAKLSDEQVEAIRVEYAVGGISQAKLGEKYGVGQAAIFKIVRFQRRK